MPAGLQPSPCSPPPILTPPPPPHAGNHREHHNGPGEAGMGEFRTGRKTPGDWGKRQYGPQSLGEEQRASEETSLYLGLAFQTFTSESSKTSASLFPLIFLGPPSPPRVSSGVQTPGTERWLPRLEAQVRTTQVFILPTETPVKFWYGFTN